MTQQIQGPDTWPHPGLSAMGSFPITFSSAALLTTPCPHVPAPVPVLGSRREHYGSRLQDAHSLAGETAPAMLAPDPLPSGPAGVWKARSPPHS